MKPVPFLPGTFGGSSGGGPKNPQPLGAPFALTLEAQCLDFSLEARAPSPETARPCGREQWARVGADRVPGLQNARNACAEKPDFALGGGWLSPPDGPGAAPSQGVMRCLSARPKWTVGASRTA